MRGNEMLHEGYWVFYCVEREDVGFEKALDGLVRKINEAEKEWDMDFLSGVHLKDDQSRSGQGTVVACQSAVLRKKPAPGSAKPGEAAQKKAWTTR